MHEMNSSGDITAAFEALLSFYIEAGVDCAVEDVPRNRFIDSTTSRRTPVADALPMPLPLQTPTVSASHHARIVPAMGHIDELTRSAREKAQAARTFEELRDAIAAFEGCALKTTAKNLVFSDGNPRARIMFVGEAPGRDEDMQGVPFVGRSGRLLDRMLTAIGLNRSKDTYIANIVPWRPPGNRTPTPQEVAACFPFIQRQIELCDPDILVCLGGPSAQALLGTKEGILRTRGRWFSYNTGKREIRALATLHPAYLLRQPLQKRLAWRDFIAIQKALAETA